MQRPNRRRVAGAAASTLTACALFAAATLPAAAMTVTFVRHGESEGNASGLIDTKTPGPPLTDQGWGEAETVASTLDGLGAYNRIYASTMQRTQQTATPFAALLRHGNVDNQDDVTYSVDPYHPDYSKDVVVLNGLQEINAGIFEGLSQDEGIGRLGYALAPLAWTLGLRFVRIPGSEDGNEFDARVDAALAQMEEQDGSDANEAVFSHGATMMFWTLMNVDNPDLSLFLSHPLENTDVVVVESNGEGGWTLKSWAGQEVGEADYATKMLVNVRDLIVAPQTALYNMRPALLTPDPEGIVKTGAQGLEDVGEATVKFVKDSITDTVDAITSIPGSLGQSTSQVSTLSAEKTDGSDTVSVKDLAEKVTEPVQAKIAAARTTNDATKLTDGNKAEPGKALSAARDRANQAADDARSGIESSVKQARDTVKKLAGAAKTDKSGDHKSGDHKAKPKHKHAA